MTIFTIKLPAKGGQGSGNFGHEGRPGAVGGSGEGGGSDKPKPGEANKPAGPSPIKVRPTLIGDPPDKKIQNDLEHVASGILGNAKISHYDLSVSKSDGMHNATFTIKSSNKAVVDAAGKAGFKQVAAATADREDSSTNKFFRSEKAVGNGKYVLEFPYKGSLSNSTARTMYVDLTHQKGK